MSRMILKLMPVAVALLLLWGCAPWPNLERDYGRSVANNMIQQMVDPQAGVEVKPPAVGLSPKAAENELERYEKSFKGEEKAAPYLGITTGAR